IAEMNFLRKLKSLKIPRLLFEAILIFSSIYLALILEADRSEDFERKKLIGNLESILIFIQNDSLKFRDMVFDFNDWNVDLNKSLKADSLSIVKLLYGNKTDVDSVIMSFTSGYLLSNWVKSWTTEPVLFSSTFENYSDLFYTNMVSTSQYLRHRKSINDANDLSIDLHNDVRDFIQSRSVLNTLDWVALNINQREELRKTFRNQYVINLMQDHYKNIYYIIRLIQEYYFVELSNAKNEIIKEIEYQKEASKGLF
ncbi:MAG: hypothetical protein AAF616_14490, partial [Bacteroidota bacterium]